MICSNEDVRTRQNLGIGSPVSGLKARAVLIDTECGVLNSLMSGPLGDIFDSRQLISDQVSVVKLAMHTTAVSPYSTCCNG